VCAAFHFPKFQNPKIEPWSVGRRSGIVPLDSRKNQRRTVVMGVSMSGFERLARLSLPRRARRKQHDARSIRQVGATVSTDADEAAGTDAEGWHYDALDALRDDSRRKRIAH
jgi:hypothetical protein